MKIKIVEKINLCEFESNKFTFLIALDTHLIIPYIPK